MRINSLVGRLVGHCGTRDVPLARECYVFLYKCIARLNFTIFLSLLQHRVLLKLLMHPPSAIPRGNGGTLDKKGNFVKFPLESTNFPPLRREHKTIKVNKLPCQRFRKCIQLALKKFMYNNVVGILPSGEGSGALL